MRILDTDLLVAWLRGDPEAEAALNLETDASTTALNAAELHAGAVLAKNPENEGEEVARLLSTLRILPFDVPAARAYGLIAARMRASGTWPGSYDALIGAVAVSQGASVVTRNEKHFRSVPGLEVQRW